MIRSDPRPQSIADIARRAKAGVQQFDLAVREFVDVWQSLTTAGRGAAIEEEPCPIGRVHDAYLAALAEHQAEVSRIAAPAWVEAPHRFLSEPFFSGGLDSLKAVLIVESPAAFRRRLIFISANALSRPRREFIQDNALSVANLDV